MKKIWLQLSFLFSISAMSYAETPEKMVELVNQVRSQARDCGNKHFSAVKPLKLNTALQRAAEKHAIDMAQKNYFEHDSLDGRTPFVRMKQEGYDYSIAGENISLGDKSAQEAIQGWLTSPGHCANMMNPKFTEMGMAGFNQYWVQTFGSPNESE